MKLIFITTIWCAIATICLGGQSKNTPPLQKGTPVVYAEITDGREKTLKGTVLYYDEKANSYRILTPDSFRMSVPAFYIVPIK